MNELLTNKIRILQHNKSTVHCANDFAESMRKKPSYLEQKMQNLLNMCYVKYEFQKILYIESIKGLISHFYIVDFYLPDKQIIIETDGKFHHEQQEKDELRIEDIQSHYPQLTFIRWENQDFRSNESVKELLKLIK